MIGFRVTCRVGAVAASILGVMAHPGLAADAASSVVTAEAALESPDALRRSKQDFATIKAARDGTLLPPKTDLPRFEMPDWQGMAAPTARAESKAPVPVAKSPTWLVDAMKKETETRDARRNGNEDPAREFTSAATANAREKELSSSTSGEAEARGDRERQSRNAQPQVLNPLERFLGDWMSPQDFALLKPGITESLGNRADRKSDLSAFTPLTTGNGILASTGESNLSALVAAPPAAITPPVPRENPYLQALTTAPLASLSLAPQMRPATSGSPAPVSLAPLPPIPAPTSKIPDFVRPTNDEKYFKPLKRF